MGRSCQGIRHPRDRRSWNDDDVDTHFGRDPRVGSGGKQRRFHSVRRGQIHQAGQGWRNRNRHRQSQAKALLRPRKELGSDCRRGEGLYWRPDRARRGRIQPSRLNGHGAGSAPRMKKRAQSLKSNNRREAAMPSRIGDALYWYATYTPNRIAIVSSAGPQTYAQLWSRVCRLSSALAELGVAPGDRIALLMQNSSRYIELY